MSSALLLLWDAGSSDVCSVKFSSKCIKPELEGLNKVLVEFQKMETQLSTFCDPRYREAALKAIQAASRQISSSDILGEVRAVVESKFMAMRLVQMLRASGNM